MAKPKEEQKVVFSLLAALIVLSVWTALIMLIWNRVLVPKVRGLVLQKLSFLDAMAIGVFASLIGSVGLRVI